MSDSKKDAATDGIVSELQRIHQELTEHRTELSEEERAVLNANLWDMYADQKGVK